MGISLNIPRSVAIEGASALRISASGRSGRWLRARLRACTAATTRYRQRSLVPKAARTSFSVATLSHTPTPKGDASEASTEVLQAALRSKRMRGRSAATRRSSSRTPRVSGATLT